MKTIKKESGITLISLIVTIIVMSLLLVSMTVNFSQTARLREFNAVKEDILTLTEAVREYYIKNGSVPGTTLVNDFSIVDKNPNDNNNYYIINTALLGNIRIRKTDNTYIVNERTLTVYLQNGINYEGKTYYTILDDFSGEISVQDYYKNVNLPIISVVTMESNGLDKTKATMGDTVTLKMLRNYVFTTDPTVTINGSQVTPSWTNNIGTATYTLTLEDMVKLEGQAIPISISGYSANGTNGVTITDVTIGNKVSVYAKLFTAADIKNNASIDSENGSFYGAYVTNYTTDNDTYIKDNTQGQNWKILYAGKLNEDDTGSHIYLITSNFIHYNGMPTVMVNGVEKTAQVTYNDGADTYSYRGNFKNVRNAYLGSESVADTMRYLNKNYYEFLATRNPPSSTRNNMKAVSYMLDTNLWSKYAKTHADWAIGGTSLELLLESLNDKYYNTTRPLRPGSLEETSTYHTTTIFEQGYDQTGNGGETWNSAIYLSSLTSDSLYFIGANNSDNAYISWVASPSEYEGPELSYSCLLSIYNTGTIGRHYEYSCRCRFSPISSFKFKC